MAADGIAAAEGLAGGERLAVEDGALASATEGCGEVTQTREGRIGLCWLNVEDARFGACAEQDEPGA